MKHVSFLIASLSAALLLLPQAAFAQDPAAEPEPEVSEPEPEVSDEEAEEGEGEGEDGAPVEPQPNIVHEPETGAGLGQTVTTPAQQSVMADDHAEEAAEEAHAEAVREDIAEDAAEGETPEEGEPSTADRLAQANPNSGLPWALPITFTQSITARTLNPSGQLTYDPTYSWSFTAVPRWNFDNGLSLGYRQNLSIEWTESNITTQNYDLWWGDGQFDATYTLPWKPGGTMIIPSFLLSLPTSEIARGSKEIIGPGARLLFIKPVPVLGGLILGGGASYTHWFATSNVAATPRGDSYDCAVLGQDATAGAESITQSCPGGTAARRGVLSAGFFGTLIPAAGWQVNLSFTGIMTNTYRLADATLSDDVIVANPDDRNFGVDGTRWRYATSFGVSVGYDVTSYMTLSLGYSTFALYPDAGGNVENPFFNENTTLNLSLQFRTDGLVVHRKAKNAEAAGEQAATQAMIAF